MTPEVVGEKTERFRVAYRAEDIGRHYSGVLHLLLASTVLVAAAAVAAVQLHDVTALQWLTIPVAFFVANGAEYLGHRGPMHHAMWPLKSLCHRHAGQHHRFYVDTAMAAASTRDWQIVLFPPLLYFFFLGGLAAPIGALLFYFASTNVGLLFVVTASLYCLSYEWLHLSYHQPVDSFVGRRAIVARLRRHHQLHHDVSKMTKWNFNITFPIFDAILSTTFRDDRVETRADHH